MVLAESKCCKIDRFVPVRSVNNQPRPVPLAEELEREIEYRMLGPSNA